MKHCSLPRIPRAALLAAGLATFVAAGCHSTDAEGSALRSLGKSESQESESQESAAEDGEGKDSPEKLAFALDMAQREVRLAQMEAATASEKSVTEVTKAEAVLAEAELALATFLEREAPQKVAESELGLSRAENRLIESRDELSELEAMYSEEQFAERTKELVLQRGQRNLAIAEAAFALAERELVTVRDHTHVAKRLEHERKVTEARAALDRAREAQAIQEFKNELELARKERAVREAQEKLEKLEKQ